MTNTLSYTERLNNRYQAIDDVITDTPLWLILTDAMCAKYDNTELAKLGQGQSSKLNMLERRVVSTFGAYVRAMDGINQRVDDNNMDRKFLVVDNNMADEVRQYVTEQQFWSYNRATVLDNQWPFMLKSQYGKCTVFLGLVL